MSNSLVINPHLQIRRVADVDDAFLLKAPVPGKSLQHLIISEAEHPDAYALLKEFTEIGFNFMDAESDIDDETKVIFETSGVLVPKESEPVMPLYVCELNKLPAGDSFAREELIVNRSLRFEPVDFTRLEELMYERHLLPTQAVAWIRNPLTGVESGYWLTPEEAELVKSMEAGKLLEIEKMPKETIRCFYAAGIVGTGEGFRKEEELWTAKIQKAATEFKELGYTVVEDLLPACHLKSLAKFYSDYIAQGFMEFGESQVAKRFWQQNEPFARLVHQDIAELMSKVVGGEVKPAYSYAASYVEGAELEPHIDREQCEYSISLQVDFKPEASDGRSPWALSLFRPEADTKKPLLFGWKALDEIGPGVSATDIYLRNGDGLFYKGRELVHYRKPLNNGTTSTSIFLHYVPLDFDGKLH